MANEVVHGRSMFAAKQGVISLNKRGSTMWLRSSGGGIKRGLDLLQSNDGRSYKLSCRSGFEIWEADFVWARVPQLNDRD